MTTDGIEGSPLCHTFHASLEVDSVSRSVISPIVTPDDTLASTVVFGGDLELEHGNDYTTVGATRLA